ncbi:MAG: hypothetical protein BGO05_05335 [Rhizobiales bacterium 63-7]|nr:hypothetical protein [Hyphomicrobiales bacterium]OJU66627.1 MAG: hypothetical protein BGO05_05335 [Rhizobiales bacterium 63-7]
MSESAAVRAMTREEISEIFTALDRLADDIDGLTYKAGREANLRLEDIRALVGDCLPGGFFGRCGACHGVLGTDEEVTADGAGHIYCTTCSITAAPSTVPVSHTAWAGGDRPVCEAFIVSVVRRDGTYDVGPAGAFWWSHTGTPLDIMSYEVVVPAEAPTDWPIDDVGSGDGER